MRRVRIVATLGPATGTPQRVDQLVRAGVDAVRLNFAHASHEEHGRLFDLVRQTTARLDRHVPVIQDLQGFKIRTTDLQGGRPVELVPGAEIDIGHGGIVSTTYGRLHLVVAPGSRILLDDGRMEVEVVAVAGEQVRCRVVKGGLLGANKGVNLPGVALGLPTLTDKDMHDLDFGLALGVDWIAVSFVRHGDDVKPLKEALKRHGVRVPVLAKIERPEALHNLNSILRTFDGIMVARGDLGVELPPEEVPIWQKTLVHRARTAGKTAIVATQMLESMINNPQPTRAEASDIANAVLDGTDAVMLSGETAVGSYPVEAVSMMSRIIEKTESSYSTHAAPPEGRPSRAGAVATAACLLASDPRTKALVVLTRSGMSARLVSMARPPVPIIAITAWPEMARQLALRWGTVSAVMEFPPTTEEAIQRVETVLAQQGLAAPGDDIVVVGSTPFAARGRTNFLKLHRIRGSS